MNKERLMQVLVEPRITERSTMVAEKNNQFVFRVATDATKLEVKRAVEMMFEVEVEAVQVLRVKGKTKIHKQSKGRRSDWKKAYVRLKSGFNIDFVEA